MWLVPSVRWKLPLKLTQLLSPQVSTPQRNGKKSKIYINICFPSPFTLHLSGNGGSVQHNSVRSASRIHTKMKKDLRHDWHDWQLIFKISPSDLNKLDCLPQLLTYALVLGCAYRLRSKQVCDAVCSFSQRRYVEATAVCSRCWRILSMSLIKFQEFRSNSLVSNVFVIIKLINHLIEWPICVRKCVHALP